MNRRMAAGLLAAALAAPAAAQQAGASYGAGIKYTDLDTRGSRGQVQEYDGKLYDRPTADAWLSAQDQRGLIDLDFRDIGSAEEYARVNVDYGSSFKGSFLYNRMTHRQNMTDFGVVINGQFVKIPAALSLTRIPPDLNIQYKRTEMGAGVAYFVPDNTARFLSLDYWTVLKKGSYPNGYYTGGVLNFKEANVDNTTHEVTAGIGRELGTKGAMALDVIRRDFQDDSQVLRFNNGTTEIKPYFPRFSMTAGELRFRYNGSKAVAVTGALTGRERENLQSQYKVRAGVAALNVAYKPVKSTSLTARLYGRYQEIDENKGWRNLINGAQGDTHQIDTLELKGDFGASWRVVEKLLLKAGYKVVVSHLRDAPSEDFGRGAYTDGTIVDLNQQANSVARDSVRHVLSVGAKADLPFDAGLDVDAQHLEANRAQFVNMPTQSDQAGVTLTVPLPARLEFYTIVEYLAERNGVQLTHYHQTRDSYRAGLDWSAASKVFVGADASYDTARYHTDSWWGINNAVTPAASGFEHVPGMYNRQNSTTAGLHGRVVLPRGFVVKGAGSYTWSTVATPLNMNPRTDPGLFLGDETPGDVRIARGRIGVEYTPPSYKRLTARASYRVDDWVDKYDSNNSGRASYTELGASMKF